MNNQQRSLKWISVKRNKGTDEIIVNKKVKDEVFDICAKDKCNLVSIFGAARQGKSFMMNCLSGKTGLFNISNLSEPCTQGIDISNTLIDLKSFSSIDNTTPPPEVIKSKMKVGFVDAEGQGDQDVTYDANLVCPILLTSKCVILNWKDSLQKDKILNHLGIMHKAAINVAMEGGLEDEESAIFGHLHFVFRDWQYENSDEKSVFKDIFKEERSTETAAAVRNQIRRSIKDSFKSINIWLFPPPVSDASQLRTKLTFEIVEAPFREKLRAFRNTLSLQLREPMKFGGRPMNGRKMGALVETVAAVLNSGETVCPEPAWISMSKSEVDALRHRYELLMRAKLDEFLTRLQTMADSCPTHDSTFLPKQDATSRVAAIIEEFQKGYAEEAELVVGVLEGALAHQVMSPSQEVVERLKSDAVARADAGYQACLQTWLQSLTRTTQKATESFLSPLLLQLPMSEEALQAEMKARCEHICTQSTLQSVEALYGVSATELSAISQQLSVFSDLLFEKYHQQNRTLLTKFDTAVEEIVQSSLVAITNQVATIIVSFEMADTSEVIPLQPKLKELDQLYFEEKKRMSHQLQVLLTTMMGVSEKGTEKNEKRGKIAQKASLSVMLEGADKEGVARLEVECAKMGAQVEAAYALAAERYFSASVARCVALVERKSRQLVTQTEASSTDPVSSADLREQFDDLVASLLEEEEEKGLGWECSRDVATKLQLTPVSEGVEKVFNTLSFLNDQINQSKKELLLARNREEEERRVAEEERSRIKAEKKRVLAEKERKAAIKAAEVAREQAQAEAKAKAQALAAAVAAEEESLRQEQAERAAQEASLLARKSSKKRRQTTVLMSAAEDEGDEEEGTPPKRQRRQTRVMERRKTKLMEEEETEETEEAEGEGGLPNIRRISVQEQRESARQYAKMHFQATSKHTAKTKKATTSKIDDEEDKEDDDDDDDDEGVADKPLTKLEQAKKKQQELMAERTKEKAAQIKAAKKRPSGRKK